MRYKALAFAIGAELAVIAYRTYNLALTGFLTSDEANYALRAILGMRYGDRLGFSYVNIIAFHLFRVDSFESFRAFLPFYDAFWSVAFLLVAWMTLRLLDVSDRARALTMLSLPFLTVLSLMSSSFLTEPVSLAFASVGVYFWLRFEKREKRATWLLLSSVFLIAATLSREPYIFMGLGLSVFLIVRGLLNKGMPRDIIAFVLPQFLMIMGASLFYASLYGQDFIEPSVTSVLWIFGSGLVLGWNPILLAVGVFGTALVLRSRDKPLIAVVGMGLFAFLATALFFGQPGYLGFTGQLSTWMRYSDVTLVVFPIVGAFAFERMGAWKSKGVVMALPIMALLLGSVFVGMAQSNLNVPYSVASTSHEFGPYKAERFFQNYVCDSPPCPVYMADDWKAGQLFLMGISGIRPEPTEPDVYLSQSNFTSDRPAQFFLLGTGPVFNSTDITMSLGDKPQPFVAQTYLSLVNGSVSALCYTVSARIVFSTPTGNLIDGIATWRC